MLRIRWFILIDQRSSVYSEFETKISTRTFNRNQNDIIHFKSTVFKRNKYYTKNEYGEF
jgi:hypothetical protein